MVWQLNATQVFFIAIIVFGVVGFIRGWRREVVSLAFTLTAVLFLYLHGGLYLTRFLFQYLPRIIGFVLTQKVPPASPYPSNGLVLVTTFLTFVVVVVAGYLVGNKAFEKAKVPADRILGVIPAIITGFAIVLSTVIVGSSLFTLAVQPLQLDSVGNYMLIIFLVALVALVVGLVSASAKKAKKS
jgi:hypothetical protein